MPNPTFIPITPDQMPASAQRTVSQPYNLQILSQGQASYTSDFLRGPNNAKLLQNLLQSRKQGIWSSRDNGFQKYDPQVFNSGATFYEFGEYLDSNGAQQMLFQCGGNLFSYIMTTHTATSLGTVPTTSNDSFYAPVPCFREFQPFQGGATTLTIMTHPGNLNASMISSTPTLTTFSLNGGTMGFWGSTASPLPAQNYGYPAFCESFLNRAVYAGWSNTLASQGILYNIIITNAGSFNTCTQNATPQATDGVVMQVPAICGRPTAIRVVQLTNQTNSQAVIVGCQKGVCVITGTNATDFALVVLTLRYGIPSNRAFAQIDNDMIYLATDGLRSYSALIVNANLLTDAISYGIQDLVQTFDQAFLNRAFIVTHQQTKDIQCWVPQLASNGASSAGHCNLGLVYNYGDSSAVVSAIPQLSFACSIRNGFNMPCAIEMQDYNNNNLWTMFSGGETGFLYTHYNGNTADGAPLAWAADFPMTTATNNLGTGFSVHKVYIICEGQQQHFYANSLFSTMMANGSIQKKNDPAGGQLIQTPPVNAAIFGQAKFGSATFGNPSWVQLLEYSPVGDARLLEVQLQGSAKEDTIDLIGAFYVLNAGGQRR